MKHPVPSIALAALLLCAAPATIKADSRVARSALTHSIAFEENRGQTAIEVDFLARGHGYVLWLAGGDAVMRLRSPQASDAENVPGSVLRWRMNTSAVARPQALDEVPARSHYLALDGASALSDVAQHARVHYSGVWPGIDLVYYGTDSGQLEFDFALAPGADPKQIGFEVDGANDLQLATNGQLHIQTGIGTLDQAAPVAYQMNGTQRQAVDARFVLEGRRVHFALGDYDHSRELIIDPVLVWSTFLGGNGDDQAYDVAERNGEAYVTGRTLSTNFPTTAGALQVSDGADADCFVSKFNAAGDSLIWSTYLGAIGNQYCNSIAVGNDGSVYVAGLSTATDAQGDAFVAKLNASGSALAYPVVNRTGNARDEAVAIAVSSAGAVTVAGYTDSTDFPTTTGVAQTSDGPGRGAFAFRLSAAGAVQWSTYLDGAGDQIGYAVAVDNASNAFVAGSSTAVDAAGDGFVLKLNSAGGLTYTGNQLAGNGADAILDLQVDPVSGEAYLTGYTESSNLPTTPGVLQTQYSGDRDAFLGKLNAAGNGFVWLSYLGGARTQSGNALARDGAGNLYVAGRTDISDPSGNLFLLKTGPAANNVVYNLQFGGSGTDLANGLSVATNGDAWLAGSTSSNDFPTTSGAYDTSKGTGLDAFVMKIGPSLANQTLVNNVTVAATAVGSNGANTSPAVTLQPGDLVTIEAVGGNVVFNTEANRPCAASAYTVDPSGFAASNPPLAPFSLCWALDAQFLPDPIPDPNGYRHAGLFRPAQTGVGAAQFIGAGSETFTYSGAAAATLKLGINDQPGTANSGQFNVRVTIVRAASFSVSVAGGNVGNSAGLTNPGVSLQPGDQVSVQPAGGSVNFNTSASGTICNASEYTNGPIGRPRTELLDEGNVCYDGERIDCNVNSQDPFPAQAHAGMIRGQMAGVGGAAWIGNAVHNFSHTGSTPVNLRLGVNDVSCASSPNSGSFNANLTITRPVSILSIDSPTRVEGNAGTSQLSFSVSLNPPSSQTVTVMAVTGDGSASAGSDYVASSQLLTFSPGQTSKTVNVTVNGDTAIEPNETVLLFLINPVNASTTKPIGVGTIVSDDLPNLAINDVNVAEGDSGTVNANFSISLTPAVSFPVGVSAYTTDGTASAGSDYVAANGSVSFAPGQTTQTFSVMVNGDNAIEPNETFFVNLSNASSANIADAQGVGTILNDDAPGVLSLQGGFTVGEGEILPVVVTVTRSNGNDGSVSVNYAISNGTATTPADWTATPSSGTLTFNQGETLKTMQFNVVDDTIDEDDGETLNIAISNPGGGATLGNASAVITIIDNDPLPNLSVDNGGCSVTEGDSGSTPCNFVLRLSAVSGRTVNFNTATANATALAGVDYTGHGTTARSIAAGQSTLTVAVPVLGDTINEPTETFNLTINSVSNASPASLGATGTIFDNDPAPVNNAAFVSQSVPGSMDAGQSYPVTVRMRNTGTTTWSTASQYRLGSDNPQDNTTWGLQRVNLPATVAPNSDVDVSFNATAPTTPGNYNFRWRMVQDGVAWFGASSSNQVIAVVNASAHGSVRLASAAIQTSELMPNVILQIQRSGGNLGAASVEFSTSNGSATAGSDYTASSGVLSWADGDSTPRSVAIALTNNLAIEPDEDFFLNLGNATGATLGSPAQTRIVIHDGIDYVFRDGFE